MILVTGANGFIGKTAVEKISRHVQTIALDKNGQAFADPNIAYTKCDITDQNGLEQLFKKYEISGIVHLASLLNRKSNNDPCLATEINITGSCRLLELSAKYRISRFIYGGSISVYGPLDSDRTSPTNESDLVNPSNVYGATKRYVELLGRSYALRNRFDFVSLRIASVIGPGNANPSSAWRSSIYLKDHVDAIPIPYGREELLPLVHVENVAGMLEKLVLCPKVTHCIYNTPSETWRLSDLEGLLQRRNPAVRFVYGDSKITDIPRFIDGRLFCKDFSFQPITIAESLDLIE